MGKRIIIPTITQPDVPNVNNVVYTRWVWRKYIESIDNGNLMIPLTLEQNNEWAKTGVVPYNKIIGFINKITNTYVIATLIDYEERYKDNPLIIDMINEYVNRIHGGDIKVYMNYFADVNHEPDMAHTYIDEIYKIMYFNLGNANPHRPVEIDPTKIKRKHYKKK